MSSRRPITVSERSKLDPFVVATGDASPRDQRDLMERPFFSLAKARRIAPILYEAGDVRVEVHAVPEHGMATIWDADVLIWAASQLVEAESLLEDFALSALHALSASHLDRPADRRPRLQAAERRALAPAGDRHPHDHPQRRALAAPSVLLDQRVGGMRDARRSLEGMEFVLPDWFYRGVIDRSLVLAIDPAYFRLTGGIERWLYRVARKHAGRQPKGWLFEIAHLHTKSGSLANSPTSPSTCGASRPAGPFRAIGCSSNARLDASCCASCPPTYPQGLWITLWTASGLFGWRSGMLTGDAIEPALDAAGEPEVGRVDSEDERAIDDAAR